MACEFNRDFRASWDDNSTADITQRRRQRRRRPLAPAPTAPVRAGRPITTTTSTSRRLHQGYFSSLSTTNISSTTCTTSPRIKRSKKTSTGRSENPRMGPKRGSKGQRGGNGVGNVGPRNNPQNGEDKIGGSALNDSMNGFCGICQNAMNFVSVGICNHPICNVCSTRMRVLCDQKNECPICRQDNPQVTKIIWEMFDFMIYIYYFRSFIRKMKSNSKTSLIIFGNWIGNTAFVSKMRP